MTWVGRYAEQVEQLGTPGMREDVHVAREDLLQAEDLIERGPIRRIRTPRRRGCASGSHELTGAEIGVIVSDSFGRAWRQGTTDVAIGLAGILPLLDLTAPATAPATSCTRR